MKTSILFCLMVFWFVSVYSQDENANKDLDWFISYYLGSGELEIEGDLKESTNIFGTTVGRNFKVNYFVTASFGLDFLTSKISYTRNDNSIFNTHRFLSIPVDFKFNTPSNKPLKAFATLGFYSGYLIRNELENIGAGTSDVIDNNGFNFGYKTTFGAQYQIDDNFDFEISFIIKDDFYETGYEKGESIELNSVYAFQLKFGFNL